MRTGFDEFQQQLLHLWIFIIQRLVLPCEAASGHARSCCRLHVVRYVFESYPISLPQQRIGCQCVAVYVDALLMHVFVFSIFECMCCNRHEPAHVHIALCCCCCMLAVHVIHLPFTRLCSIIPTSAVTFLTASVPCFCHFATANSTMGYILAPCLVPARLCTKAAAIMVLVYKASHILGLMAAISIALWLYGDISGAL